MRSRLLRVHRWLSLGVAVFWLIQAISGAIIVHHWEIEDATVPGAHRPTDLIALERRIDGLAPRGSDRRPVSLWVTAGFDDRYEFKFAAPDGRQTSVRLAGDGTVLRMRDTANRTVMGTLVTLHQKLLAGETGEWIVGLSGVLLLSNLVMGFTLAWPRTDWLRALRPPRRHFGLTASLQGWHRALGLWLVIPAIVLVTAGTLLRFEDGVGAAIGAKTPALEPIPRIADTALSVGLYQVVTAGVGAIPGSRLTAVVWPGAEDATWSLRVLEPGEIRRAYGTSRVFVDGNSGAVRAIFPASLDTPANRFMNGLFAVHTGEVGGAAGRLVVVALGLWLATMIALGLSTWWRRRATGAFAE